MRMDGAGYAFLCTPHSAVRTHGPSFHPALLHLQLQRGDERAENLLVALVELHQVLVRGTDARQAFLLAALLLEADELQGGRLERLRLDEDQLRQPHVPQQPQQRLGGVDDGDAGRLAVLARRWPRRRARP